MKNNMYSLALIGTLLFASLDANAMSLGEFGRAVVGPPVAKAQSQTGAKSTCFVRAFSTAVQLPMLAWDGNQLLFVYDLDVRVAVGDDPQTWRVVTSVGRATSRWPEVLTTTMIFQTVLAGANRYLASIGHTTIAQDCVTIEPWGGP